MNESLMLYKLITLYMVKYSSAPLTNGAISEFVLSHDYTDYFTLQQSISELFDMELLREEKTRNGDFYHITEKGDETLRFFKEKISDAIISEMDEYIGSNRLSIINTASVITDYYKTSDVGYDVNLKIREKNRVVFELTVNVDDKADAEAMCDNFKEKNQSIYEYVVKNLLY